MPYHIQHILLGSEVENFDFPHLEKVKAYIASRGGIEVGSDSFSWTKDLEWGEESTGFCTTYRIPKGDITLMLSGRKETSPSVTGLRSPKIQAGCPSKRALDYFVKSCIEFARGR